MKRRLVKGALIVSVLCMLLAGALALAGCAGRGTLSSDIDDTTGTYVAKANDAGKGSAVAASGVMVVKEGQILVISPDMQKGYLQIRLLNAAGDVVVNEKASGHALATHEIAPDDYAIGVACDVDGATGTVTVAAVDAAEFEKQNHDLEATLATMKTA